MDFSEKQEKEIKVGIIGCGYVFDHYMSTWNRYPSLSIKGIADIDSARLKTVAKAYNLSIFNTNEDLLSDPSCMSHSLRGESLCHEAAPRLLVTKDRFLGPPPLESLSGSLPRTHSDPLSPPVAPSLLPLKNLSPRERHSRPAELHEASLPLPLPS